MLAVMAEEKEACSSHNSPLLFLVMTVLCWLCHLSDLQKVNRIQIQSQMDDYSFWMKELNCLTGEYQGHCREWERLHEEQNGKEMGERNRSEGGEARPSIVDGKTLDCI